MTKNFNTIHAGGVYSSNTEGDYVIWPRDKLIKDSFAYQKHDKFTGYYIDKNSNDLFSVNEYPSWMPYDENGVYRDDSGYSLAKYLGEWDFDKNELILHDPPNEASDAEDDDFLVESKTIEVVDVYEHGIFRAKVATRNNSDIETWVHFDSKCEFDDGIYGYTKNEFLSLMPLLRQIENKFLAEYDED